MNDCNTEKFRNCFAEKLALVCLILAAAISLLGLLKRRRRSLFLWLRTVSFPKANRPLLVSM